jgi:flagellin
MALTINTNISALTAQRNLGTAAAKSASSLAKLSSGSRVPSAKDDAAALAIGSSLRAEVNALKQASQNAAQAVSLLQIADGALATVGDILVRLKSLATQASSGQLGSSERALLDQEFDELRNEITRIANDTDFNGTQLLNGADTVASFTEGKNGALDAQGITLLFDTGELGADEVFAIDYNYTDAAQDTGVITVTNLTTGETQAKDIASLVQGVTSETSTDLTTDLGAGQTVDVAFDAIGVTLRLDDRFDVNVDYNQTLTATENGAQTGGTVTATVQNGSGLTGANFAAVLAGGDYNSATGILGIQVDSTTTANTVNFAATVGVEFSTDGVTFASTAAGVTTNGAGDGIFVRFGSAGDSVIRLDLSSYTSTTTADTTGTIDLDLGGLFRVEESTSTTAQFNFRVGTGAIAANDEISISINAVTTAALGIAASDIGDSEANAEGAITDVSSAITTISSRRANIGASQSRLEFASASIGVAIENISAATSALLDVDVSSEITEFTSKQVLLQAGISLLAQANQQPALLLRLLQ